MEDKTREANELLFKFPFPFGFPPELFEDDFLGPVNFLSLKNFSKPFGVLKSLLKNEDNEEVKDEEEVEAEEVAVEAVEFNLDASF